MEIDAAVIRAPATNRAAFGVHIGLAAGYVDGPRYYRKAPFGHTAPETLMHPGGAFFLAAYPGIMNICCCYRIIYDRKTEKNRATE